MASGLGTDRGGLEGGLSLSLPPLAPGSEGLCNYDHGEVLDQVKSLACDVDVPASAGKTKGKGLKAASQHIVVPTLTP